MSKRTQNRIALFFGAMTLLHVIVLRQEWWAIPIGFPDFSIFYTAGTILREGHGNELYDQQLQEAVQGSFAAEGIANRGSILPYFHPPFEAVFFVPFTFVPYLAAYLIFAALNLAFVISTCLILRKQLLIFSSLPLWLWILTALGFTPIFIALMQGQDSIFLLFCYAMAYVSLRRSSDLQAGAWLGFGLCKYHLLLPFMLAFLMERRKKVIAGFLLVVVVLGIVSFVAIGWQGLRSYPQFAWMSEHSMRYRWNNFHGNTTNLRGLLLSLLPFRWQLHSRAVLIVVIALSMCVLSVVDYAWVRANPENSVCVDLRFALNLLGTLLVSYHTFAQDMSLLFMAILLVFNVLFRNPKLGEWQRKALLVSGALLFCAPIYLVLVLAFGQLSAITWLLLFFFISLLSLMFRSQASRREVAVVQGAPS
ncbi:MAG TPA: glycosyltransferase family 87 protein [Terriglobales bacterium]|nr:glycosyltransferase family 87 protein [Terriglobales bacterium]